MESYDVNVFFHIWESSSKFTYSIELEHSLKCVDVYMRQLANCVYVVKDQSAQILVIFHIIVGHRNDDIDNGTEHFFGIKRGEYRDAVR